MNNRDRNPRRHARPLTLEEAVRRSVSAERSIPTLQDAFADLKRREGKSFEPEPLLDWIAQYILRLYAEPKVPATESSPALYYKIQVQSASEAAEEWRKLRETSSANLTEADSRTWISLSIVVSAKLASRLIDAGATPEDAGLRAWFGRVEDHREPATRKVWLDTHAANSGAAISSEC